MPTLGYVNEGRGRRHRKEERKQKSLKPRFIDENDKGEDTSAEPLSVVFEDIKEGDRFQIAFLPTGKTKTEEVPTYVRIKVADDSCSRPHNCQNLLTGLTERLSPFMPVVVITTE